MGIARNRTFTIDESCASLPERCDNHVPESLWRRKNSKRVRNGPPTARRFVLSVKGHDSPASSPRAPKPVRKDAFPLACGTVEGDLNNATTRTPVRCAKAGDSSFAGR